MVKFHAVDYEEEWMDISPEEQLDRNIEMFDPVMLLTLKDDNTTGSF